MKQITKYIGLLAILPLVLVALTPDLIGEADAARNDANINNPDDTSENRDVNMNKRSAAIDADGVANEERDTAAKNLAKGQ
ncbi:MAG: exported protein of unknown function [Nitrosopumilales archaeon]|nr:MAG: exported protein of unknown function [Nitrosopumilales archaeon]